MRLRRVGDRPIIDPSTHPNIGHNIQGPSLVRAPAWMPDPPGAYLLYFADHKGDHIRLAVAEHPAGPWTVVPGGALHLADSHFLTEAPAVTSEQLEEFRLRYRELYGGYEPGSDVRADVVTPHIASPDVRVNDELERFELYFHGLESLGWQASRFASSSDGRTFSVDPTVIPETYLRAFTHDGVDYALAMPGTVLRRTGGPADFERGPELFPPIARHAAVRVVGDRLDILWTQVGHAPERLLLSTVDVSGRWESWVASEPVEVLRPEHWWEGADEPVAPSVRGAAPGRVNQLRDPAVLVDGDRTWVVYAVAGESGLALAELED